MGPICLTNTGTPPDTSTASSRPADLLAGTGTDQVRAHDQAQDRKGARPRSATVAARPSRRGDRMIGRRAFITLLGGAAAGWPLATCAQQGERMRRIGVLIGRRTMWITFPCLPLRPAMQSRGV